MQFSSLPVGSLPDQAAKIKLVTDIEQKITDEINGVLNSVVPEVAQRARANQQFNSLAEVSLPGQPLNVALGMAMRFYAGFLGMAKTLREKAAQGPTFMPTGVERTLSSWNCSTSSASLFLAASAVEIAAGLESPATSDVSSDYPASQRPNQSSYPPCQHVGRVVDAQINAADSDEEGQEHGAQETVQFRQATLHDLHQQDAKGEIHDGREHGVAAGKAGRGDFT